MKSVSLSVGFICLLAVTCRGVIDAESKLNINFTDPNDTKAKATWSKELDSTSQGLGWSSQESNASRECWILSTELAIGLSWRPTQIAHVTVELEPILKPITLPNGQTYTRSPGSMFVRHSPDAKQWSSWQQMQRNAIKNDRYSYTAVVSIPQMDREKYGNYVSQYSTRRDVPWTCDEEAVVKWIIKQDPNFFHGPAPFIGYLQVLYSGSLQANQRLTRLDITASWAVPGLHVPPKDPNTPEYKQGIPWRYRADK